MFVLYKNRYKNGIELVVTSVPPPISANQEDEQQELLPHGSIDDFLFKKEMPMEYKMHMKTPELPTTRTGRVHTRLTNTKL